jgi:hypothetical protein
MSGSSWLAVLMLGPVLASSLVCSIVVALLRRHLYTASALGITLGLVASYATFLLVAGWFPDLPENSGVGVLIYSMFAFPEYLLAQLMAIVWPIAITLVEVSVLAMRKSLPIEPDGSSDC